MPRAFLGGGVDHLVDVEADDARQLFGHALRLGVRQVDLVDDGDDRQVVLEGGVEVGQRLRLHALCGVDDQQGALAGHQRARDLVGEVDVAGRVDQVELVLEAVGGACRPCARPWP